MHGNFILPIIVFLPMISAVVSYIIGRKNKKLRNLFVQIISIGELILLAYMLFMNSNNSAGLFTLNNICGMNMSFAADGFRTLYGCIGAFMWAMTALFSEEYFGHYRNRNRYYMFFLLTLGATEGVLLSADLFTTFIFFEIMSFTSYMWVAHEESKEALKAAETYLGVAVIGGLVMLLGLFLLYNELGTLDISLLKNAVSGVDPSRKGYIYAAGGCMLFGFGAKAGMFPLQIWLPKAHPVAPAPASALLSGILTKAGIYGILILTGRIFFDDDVWGTLILSLGVITMFLGALLAVFSVNLKRTLACSSVSQIGFILVGIGMSALLKAENILAVRGSILHMVNHSLIKLALFMAAGVVYMNIHELELNKIQGFGRGKWFLNAVFLMGALGIGGIPFWNGYVSKTLLHESIVEYTELLEEGHLAPLVFSYGGMKAIEWIFLISGGMTVAYMTKLYIAVFVEKNKDEELQKKYDSMNKSYLGVRSKIALGLSAVVLPLMGMLPGVIMDKAADLGQSIMAVETAEEKIAYFSFGNIKGALISIAIGILLYFIVIRILLMKKDACGRSYVNKWPVWLDLENLIYRPILVTALPFVFGVMARFLDSLTDWIVVFLRKTIYRDSPLPEELPEGNRITYFFGSIADFVSRKKNRDNKEKKSYTHILAMKHEAVRENMFIVSRSMSFGLMLFCVGLLATVTYLLFINK